MKFYIYFFRSNRLKKYFLLRALKKKGYSFRNGMSQKHIFVNIKDKYAYCMCNKVAHDRRIIRWMLKNCIFEEEL